MLLKHFYDPKLAQASYLVGCTATGEALVVDPNRNIDQYVRAAEAAGVRITHVTETHIHADFVSGARELAARTGAVLYLSAEGGPDWQYSYAAEDGAVLLKDGDHFRVGNIKVQAMHTPGHTPEHLSFLVTDTPATDRPIGVFTGDFVFVGDVGRPDLLEKAAEDAGNHGRGCPDVLPVTPELQAAAGLPPDLARPRRGLRLRQVAGRGACSRPSVTSGLPTGPGWR